jgi:hypothetical protein
MNQNRIRYPDHKKVSETNEGVEFQKIETKR